MSRKGAYGIWKAMLNRCRNPNNKDWHNYGGRGIKACERWHDYANFAADMGDKPSPEYTVERIDNNGDYCPENCRWATRQEQAKNTRCNVKFTFEERTMLIADWCRTEEVTITEQALRDRLRNGWPVREALFSPPGMRKSVAIMRQEGGRHG